MGFLEELVEWGRMLQEIHAKVVSGRSPVQGKPWSQTSQFDWVLLSPMQRRRIRDVLEEAKTISNAYTECTSELSAKVSGEALAQLANRIKLAEGDLGKEVYTGKVCGVGGNPTGYPLEDVPEEDWPNFDPMVLPQD